jgi:DNA polymerase-4
MARMNSGELAARVILHVDMDAFYASVEQRDRPELRGRPVVVGAAPDQRGVVAACSYEARRFGVRSAMPSREAGRLCPQAVFLPPDMPRYEAASRQVFDVFGRFTPFVEALSIDEAFLDVTSAQRLFGDGAAIARSVKATIRGETGLTASVGVAANKFLAKVASDMGKPDGLVVVPPGREAIATFLAPMPVGRVWGVGEVTQSAFLERGIRTIGDLQRMTEPGLAAIVGGHAASHILKLAWGEDERAVETGSEEKSISREHTFPSDVRGEEPVKAVLLDLVEDVGHRLREAGKYAGTARLKLRWQGFVTITRQAPLAPPCRDDMTLTQAALRLLAAEPLVKPVRLVGFGVTNLKDNPQWQPGLFDDSPGAGGKREQLSRAVDTIRHRHGAGSIVRGSRAPGGGSARTRRGGEVTP